MNSLELSACGATRVLVIGFGSIGRRHARLFAQIGASVTVISRRASELNETGILFYPRLDMISVSDFDYVIIASETSAHLDDLNSVLTSDLAADAPILVEKPLVGEKSDLAELRQLPGVARIRVGFNLRFLPVLIAAREHFSLNDPLIRADFCSHSYLPNWRPDQDYRTTSSAQKKLGGGVLRDLSHELDLLYWFCGVPTDMSAFGGHLSQLDIDVEDNVQIVGTSDICRLFTVSLSYTQHLETRTLTLISERKTILVDLMIGTLRVGWDGGAIEEAHPCEDFDDTYRGMHASILQKMPVNAADFEAGCANVELIDRLARQLEADL